MRRRILLLLVVLGLILGACLGEEVTTTSEPETGVETTQAVAGRDPVAVPELDVSTTTTSPSTSTTVVSPATTAYKEPDPETLAAWEQLATRVELLAKRALVHAELIDTAMDVLPDEALTKAGWFESCCADSRGDLKAILEDISTELEAAEELVPDLGTWRVSTASEFLRIASEGTAFAIYLLESGIESGEGGGVMTKRSMVEEGLPTIITHTIVGCVRACVIDPDQP